MSNISIGRYGDDCTVTLATGETYPLADDFDGWIEGESDEGVRWIIYLDGNGVPAQYWPKREDDGAVIGDPIDLRV